MNAYPELTGLSAQPNLRALVDNLAERNRQMLEGSLSHIEFLMLLLQDEPGRRPQKRSATRRRQPNYRMRKPLRASMPACC